MRFLTSSVAAFAAIVAATGSSMARGCQYCSDGPCVPARSHGFSYQTTISPGKNAELSLTVTLPGKSESIKRPFPVIFFFNGFQVTLHAKFYANATSLPCCAQQPALLSMLTVTYIRACAGALWLLQGICRAFGIVGICGCTV